MAYQTSPYPEWSWSLSRDHMFHTCKRQYYYHYYGAHGGWLMTASDTARTAYRLKQLKNLYILLGDAVHTAAQKLLDLRETQQAYPDEAAVNRFLRQSLNQAYVESKKKDEWWAYPKQYTMLHEMYYEGELAPARVEAIAARMPVCAHGLLESDTWRELVRDQTCTIVEVEQLNHITIHDTKVYVKLDALYRRPDGIWVIADWKTGRISEKNREQLWLYALYVNECYGVPLEQIEVRTEYLLDGICDRTVPNEEELDIIAHKIRVSTESMKQYSADDYYNRPLTEESFHGVGEPSTCIMCNYRQICPAAKLG
ncbi:PD-(D/E)XK nuclease family protein [Aneurinibacillus uraniidurans]|uniref:PD-(D/E)XK nuclease family protein n=1 Tax=Aneurinibacillus uraniidurans TaxID=2966586 RepID=UPI00234B4F8B|nr:PD-(D/E)XK nuclease family protein [Aneurinibacillus sp. B1]WCN36370.1 PD-(D/E)XK nuclease family protein [Aneurinibacillus sp. B1]